MAEYLEVDEARERPGLRLVLTAGVPGPWGEAAKAIFHVKGIPYLRVRQRGGLPNQALHDWTGRDNAPVAVLDDERPRSGCAEILLLAERMEPEPALLPADPEQRALMFGLAHEICGEQGFGWCRRLMLLDPLIGRGSPEIGPGREIGSRLAAKYGYDPEAAAAAPERCAQILTALARRLSEQHAAGRRFLLGDTLTALDLYWAAFCALVEPLPHELCPMDPGLRAVYTVSDPVLRKLADPILLDHREFVYRDYLELPLDF